MNNVLKKVILILIVLITLFSINSKVFAWSEIIDDGKSFIDKADKTKTPIDEQGLKNVSGYLYNILLAAGVIISVIVATVLGVQFMLGGAEGQAKVKEMILPFVVGCIVVFGGFGFWKIAITVGEKLEKVESNQYDFSESTCTRCGQKVTPKFDIDTHKYVCPRCGREM